MSQIHNKPIKGVWTEQYALKWEEASVSGNGKHAVMVFGDPQHETIIGNHCRLYLPTGTGKVIPNMARYLDRLRDIISEKGYEDAIDFFYQKAKELGYPGLQMSDPFHPGFHLTIEMPETEVAQYSRSTNFETGEITITFRDGQNRWNRRSSFVSQEEDVIVHRLEVEEGEVNCNLRIRDEVHPFIDREIKLSNKSILINNTYLNSEGGYQVAIKLVTDCGKTHIEKDGISIEQAKSVLLIMKIVCNSSEKKLNEDILIEELRRLAKRSYHNLFEGHEKIHSEIFSRVRLDLVDNSERSSSVDELQRYAQEKDTIPLALLEKMYDAGRYMFICSAGELAPNLQGIWTGTYFPPWSGDFTFDTNVQLAIAGGLSGRLLEGMHGFFRLIGELESEFKENAMHYYGCRGIMASAHSSNSGRHFHWNKEWPLHFWTCGAGWLGHWFYQYYQFTGDKAFLQNRTIPYLKLCALFYEDFLIEDDDGYYRFTPSYSAENGCGDNATQDIAVAKEVLTNLIASHEELGIELDELVKWKAMLKKLPPYRINEEGVLQEWAIDGREEHYNHRHFSHLYPIFQSREFTKKSDPILWEAAEKALDKRLNAWLRSDDADTSSSHGRMHAALCATQFNRDELVYEILKMMVLHDSMYSTLMTSHYNNQHLFNVDANGAIPQIIHEMLVDAVPGRVILLRALPKEIMSGKIAGMALPKQIVVNKLMWDLQERNLTLVLTSSINQSIIVEAPLIQELCLKKQSGCTVKYQDGEIKVSLHAQRPAKLLFRI